MNGEGEEEFTVSFYPNPNVDPQNPTECSATEVNFYSSAVESDQGCAMPIEFVLGQDEEECTIVNTVFFEGIPTLSQWGMAIMALLMLGIGFVSVRRFA